MAYIVGGHKIITEYDLCLVLIDKIREDNSIHENLTRIKTFTASLKLKPLRLSQIASLFSNRGIIFHKMPLNQHKNTNPSSTENCRTCVDFKTWAKQQRKSLTTTEVNCEIH